MEGVTERTASLAFAFTVFIVASVTLQSVEGGTLRSESTNSYKRLLFHEGGSKNAVITKNNTLAYMLSDEGDRPYSAVLTNRHLRRNELFQVILEKTDNSKNESLYLMTIGVTNLTHDDIKNISYIEPRDWLMQWHLESEDGNDNSFQKFLQFGIKLGVMRTENDNLDIFVNGVNEGIISTNVSESVYGVIEFLTGGLQATIMDSSTTLCHQ